MAASLQLPQAFIAFPRRRMADGGWRREGKGAEGRGVSCFLVVMAVPETASPTRLSAWLLGRHILDTAHVGGVFQGGEETWLVFRGTVPQLSSHFYLWPRGYSLPPFRRCPPENLYFVRTSLERSSLALSGLCPWFPGRPRRICLLPLKPTGRVKVTTILGVLASPVLPTSGLSASHRQVGCHSSPSSFSQQLPAALPRRCHSRSLYDCRTRASRWMNLLSYNIPFSPLFSDMVPTAVPEGEDGGDKEKGKRRGNKRAGGKTQRASGTA